MQAHRASAQKMVADKHTMCVAMHAVCIKVWCLSEALLRSEAVQLPEQGSPAALIPSFIKQG